MCLFLDKAQCPSGSPGRSVCLFTAFGTDGVHMQHIPLGRQLHFIYVVWGHFKKMLHKVGETGSAVKACAANPDDPSSIPKTNMVGGAAL